VVREREVRRCGGLDYYYYYYNYYYWGSERG
jgi:hypothetical protein